MKIIRAILILFLISCTEKKKEESSKKNIDLMQLENSSSIFGKEDLTGEYLIAKEKYMEMNSKVVLDPIFLDTLIYDFNIQYLMRNIGELIVSGDSKEGGIIQYYDNELIINSSKGGEIQFIKKVFRKEDFFDLIEGKELKKYLITRIGLEGSSPKGYLLNVMICQPDTDDCYAFNLEINFIGKIEIQEIELDYSDSW